MAIDPAQLVLDRLRPDPEMDPDFTAYVGREIEAKRASQGWEEPLTDARAVYLAALVAKAGCLRLMSVYRDQVRRTEENEDRVEWQNYIDFLKEMAAQADDEIRQSARQVEPEDVIDEQRKPWPKPRMLSW